MTYIGINVTSLSPTPSLLFLLSLLLSLLLLCLAIAIALFGPAQPSSLLISSLQQTLYSVDGAYLIVVLQSDYSH